MGCKAAVGFAFRTCEAVGEVVCGQGTWRTVFESIGAARGVSHVPLVLWPSLGLLSDSCRHINCSLYQSTCKFTLFHHRVDDYCATCRCAGETYICLAGQ